MELIWWSMERYSVGDGNGFVVFRGMSWVVGGISRAGVYCVKITSHGMGGW